MSYNTEHGKNTDSRHSVSIATQVNSGERHSVWKLQQEVDTISLVGAPPMRFRLSEGFPVITERNMAPEFKAVGQPCGKQAIAELTGFINGGRTQAELEKFGCSWWKPWVTERKCHKRGLKRATLVLGHMAQPFTTSPRPKVRRLTSLKKF